MQQYQRIISLVPSQTELLFDLGLAQRVVGVTKFCIYPPEARLKTQIGGTKTLDIAAIEALQPDLIIGNIEENEKAQIEHLQLTQNVVMSDIYTLDDALEMIAQIGTLTQTETAAAAYIADIRTKFERLRHLVKPMSEAFKQPTAAYFIWRKPYMIAAKNTFIDAMLHEAGFKNAFSELRRYPIVTADELKTAQPDYIFLSSEPFPFKEKHVSELAEICPSARIMIVDGEIFSWYGSRLRYAPDYFLGLK